MQWKGSMNDGCAFRKDRFAGFFSTMVIFCTDIWNDTVSVYNQNSSFMHKVKRVGQSAKKMWLLSQGVLIDLKRAFL